MGIGEFEMEEKDLVKDDFNSTLYDNTFLKEIIDFDDLFFQKLIDKKCLDLFILKNVIDGKIKITDEIAKKLVILMPEKRYTFWLSIQKHYDQIYSKED